jgi:nucleolin
LFPPLPILLSIFQDVDGRPIRVNISVARGTDRTFGDRPPRAPSERNYDFDARKIYFGNLSW